MRYKGCCEMLFRIAEEYKDFVVSKVETYKRITEQTEATIKKNEGVWLDEYKQKYRDRENPSDTIARDVAVRRNMSKAAANSYLDKLQNEIYGYFSDGVDPSFGAKIAAYESVGLKLSKTDVRILLSKARTFTEKRLVYALFDKLKEDDKVTDWADVAFIDGDLPNVDATIEAFEAFRNRTNSFFDNYAGEYGELSNILTTTPQELVLGEYTYLQHGSIFKFKEILDGLVAYAPATSELSEAERSYIDSVLDPKYPHLARSQAKELYINDPELGELLELDPRYADVVAGEVS